MYLTVQGLEAGSNIMIVAYDDSGRMMKCTTERYIANRKMQLRVNTPADAVFVKVFIADLYWVPTRLEKCNQL